MYQINTTVCSLHPIRRHAVPTRGHRPYIASRYVRDGRRLPEILVDQYPIRQQLHCCWPYGDWHFYYISFLVSDFWLIRNENLQKCTYELRNLSLSVCPHATVWEERKSFFYKISLNFVNNCIDFLKFWQSNGLLAKDPNALCQHLQYNRLQRKRITRNFLGCQQLRLNIV